MFFMNDRMAVQLDQTFLKSGEQAQEFYITHLLWDPTVKTIRCKYAFANYHWMTDDPRSRGPGLYLLHGQHGY